MVGASYVRIAAGGQRRSLVASALVVLALALVALVVAAMTTFALPAPTGSFSIGTTTMTLTRPKLDHEQSGGTFVVQIWYPAMPSGDRAPYGTGTPGIKRFVYHYLVRTHAARDATVAAAATPFPILLYVSGWGGQRSDNTVLAEELASHGFVVAALGDVASDDPPLPRLSALPDFSSQSAYEATLAIADEKVLYESRRASQVLDHLLAIEGGQTGRLERHLDSKRVGIFGYSLGGAVALETSRRDPRFKAALNLDGWLFNAGSPAARDGHPLYFLISDGAPPPTDAELTAADPQRRYPAILTAADERKQRDIVTRGGFHLRIAGTHHLSFTDAPLYAPLQRFRTGFINPRRAARIIGLYAVAFFDVSLNGRRSPLLERQTQHDPAVTIERWPANPVRSGYER